MNNNSSQHKEGIKNSDCSQVKYDLSVIIITRNEEEIIEDCISSVLSAIEYAKGKKFLKSSEVILVDSASTDNTIKIAERFPIKIIRLNSSLPLSAGAGMYIGVLHSYGRFLAKVDGDTIVYRDWFANALPHLEDEKVAGVTGVYKEEIKDTNLIGLAYSNASKHQPPGKVDVIATGIFKKDILLKVGSFNPFLKAAEDRDISWKIHELGYELIRLPFFEIQHFIAGINKKMTYIEHLKKMFVYSIGEGHAAKYSIENRNIFMKYILRYATIYFANSYILILLWINLLYSNYTLFSNTNDSSKLVLIADTIILILSIFILIVKYKGKSEGQKLKKILFPFEVFPYMIVRHVGFIIGMMKLRKKSSKYPLNIEIIKE